MKPYRVLRSNEKQYRLLHNADVAIDKRTKKLVIVRCSNMFPFNEFDGIPSRPLHEASVLRRLQHPNIIRLLEADISRNKFYRVYEYMDSDLLAFLRSRAFNGALLSAEHQKSLISQVLRAVDYSHSHGIIHRNLCLRNCLVDDTGTTEKITGFNLSRSYAPPMRQFSHEITRLWYRPPEILLGQEVYTPKVDIWSVGVIVAEIFRAGESLFPGDCEIDTLFRIFRTLGKTVVMVTHDLGEAAFFGDVIAVLREGAIVQAGSFAELVRAPADDFVTRFVRAQRPPKELLEGGLS